MADLSSTIPTKASVKHDYLQCLYDATQRRNIDLIRQFARAI